LDQTFTTGSDHDSNNQRDFPISELSRRFNRTSNGGVSEDERWAIPNILRVTSQSYPTFDQAAIFTAMTETVKVLNTEFNAAWAANNTLKPTLLFAYEQRARSVSL